MKTDTELEALLRETLRTRAGDVTEAARRPNPGAAQRRMPRWFPVLVAAAAVVAVAAGVVLGVRAIRANPPAHPSPTVHTSPAPRPSPSPHAQRRVSLNWFGMAKLPGWELHVRESKPGYRLLAVRRADDPDVPIGCNGCESASDYVYVIDHFAAAEHRVTTWQQVQVGGHRGYLGSMREYPLGKYVVPTLAWQFRPGGWVLVQGVTPLGGAEQNLLRVARAVQPTKSVPIRLPFTLGYVPALPITDVTDDRSEGYAFTISFGYVAAPGSAARSLDLTLWPSYPGEVRRSAATRRTVGGLTGWYDHGVVDVPIPGGVVEFGISHAASVTTADLRETLRIMHAIRWANGDGSTPWPTAEQAIP